MCGWQRTQFPQRWPFLKIWSTLHLPSYSLVYFREVLFSLFLLRVYSNLKSIFFKENIRQSWGDFADALHISLLTSRRQVLRGWVYLAYNCIPSVSALETPFVLHWTLYSWISLALHIPLNSKRKDPEMSRFSRHNITHRIYHGSHEVFMPFMWIICK